MHKWSNKITAIISGSGLYNFKIILPSFSGFMVSKSAQTV